MCEQGLYELVDVIVPPKSYGGSKIEKAEIDQCIAPLVRALNNYGIPTVSSCCGHGKIPGSIELADGRVLMITKNWEDAKTYFSIAHKNYKKKIKKDRKNEAEMQ